MPSRHFALVALALPALVLPLLTSCGREGPTELSPTTARTAPVGGIPSPEITFGPFNNGWWGPDVRFEWIETPPAAGREWALLHTDEYLADTGAGSIQTGQVIAWMDTLQFHPGTTDPAWISTPDDFVTFEDVAVTDPSDRWIFGVRSYDEGGVRAPLSAPTNMRFFRVNDSLSGPHIALHTSYGDCVGSEAADPGVTIFRTGIRLEWSASPGISGTPSVETAWAIGDPTGWTPAGAGGGTYPPENEDPWVPDLGPVTFHVRAVDQAGFETILSYELDVRTFAARGVLAVLDTSPGAMVTNGIWPQGYEIIERALVRLWLAGRALSVHETMGFIPPPADDLARASTIVWFHSADVRDGDVSSLLDMFEQNSALRSLITTWHEAGGNFVLCGLNPVDAMRYFTSESSCQAAYIQNDPVVFAQTLTDTTLVPHFATTRLSVERVTNAWRNAFSEPQEGRLTIARSALSWLPDLEFDPTTYPNGPVLGGFGYWDNGIVPLEDAVVAYTANDTSDPVATLLLNGPGRRGNAFYLGMHPYFLDDPQTIEMFGAVLDAFGELSLETAEAPD